MSKHTPGPWRSFQQADGTRHLVVAGDGLKPNEPIVASVSGYTATMNAAEEANARLIAAAPELLSACASLLKLVGELNQYVLHDDTGGVMAAGRAAIAKAKGGGA